MDDRLGPGERHGGGIVGFHEGIDVILGLLDVGEASARQGVALQDGEPDLDLVEPGTVGRREVETDIGMASQPAIVLGLVCL